MNVNSNTNSYHACKLKYRFVSQMRTRIWTHIMNANLNMDSYHKYKLDMNSYHKCKLKCRFISQIQTWIQIHTTNANLDMDSYHKCKLGYGSISQMWTWIWIYIANTNANPNHECKCKCKSKPWVRIKIQMRMWMQNLIDNLNIYTCTHMTMWQSDHLTIWPSHYMTIPPCDHYFKASQRLSQVAWWAGSAHHLHGHCWELVMFYMMFGWQHNPFWSTIKSSCMMLHRSKTSSCDSKLNRYLLWCFDSVHGLDRRILPFHAFALNIQTTSTGTHVQCSYYSFRNTSRDLYPDWLRTNWCILVLPRLPMMMYKYDGHKFY